MFTGLVETVGTVVDTVELDGARRLTVEAPAVAGDVGIGESIALDGCCVTVVAQDAAAFTVDVMRGTLAVTTLGRLTTADRVNLERAMRLDDRLGGHLVQGHVDGVAQVVAVEDPPGARVLTLRLPDGLERYAVAKGSITLAGVSLTIAEVDGADVRIGLIPHTREVTTLGGLGVGARVNVEADVLAKHVERLLVAGLVPSSASSVAAAPGPTTGRVP